MENQESYMQWRTETGLVEALEEFLDGELIIKKYSPKGCVIMDKKFDIIIYGATVYWSIMHQNTYLKMLTI